MRRLLPLALVLLAGCGDAAPATTVPGQPTGPASSAGTGGPAATPAATTSAGATAASGVAIPADCAVGFTAYLKVIEPVVAGFSPATSAFGSFFAVDEEASSKGIDVMMANDGRATYSCPDVGLEFAYFDARSPWAAILEIARAQAPGTLPYLQVKQQVTAIDDAQLSDYDAATCEDAVARIRKGVADATAAGNDIVAQLSVDSGLALFGLYQTYMSAVDAGTCPADVLGNDESGFMIETLPG